MSVIAQNNTTTPPPVTSTPPPPTTTGNPTISDLQTQIANLTAQIQALLSSQGSTPPATLLTQPLKLGDSGPQVTLLQNILKKLGFFPINIQPNGYFGPATLKAVEAFQVQYNIANPTDSSYGHVGPATRAKLNELNG
jgi:peptidoglycan hydrolase-like protein with peptidoglycan-binding domain